MKKVELLMHSSIVKIDEVKKTRFVPRIAKYDHDQGKWLTLEVIEIPDHVSDQEIESIVPLKSM